MVTNAMVTNTAGTIPAARTICVYASQVAACVGANKYQSPSAALESMWQRCDPAGFAAALRRHGARTDEEIVRELAASHEEVARACRDSAAATCDSTADVAARYEVARRELSSLAEDDRRVVDDAVRRTLYTEYGTRHEARALEYVRMALGISCVLDPRFHKRQGGVVGEAEPWFVGGKIDAISEDGTVLVEVKNRVRRLFRRVPAYENVQVQTYLHVLDLEHAVLVERLDSEAHAVPIRRDRQMWEQDVAPKLQRFVEHLHAVVHDVEAQDAYFAGGRQFEP